MIWKIGVTFLGSGLMDLTLVIMPIALAVLIVGLVFLFIDMLICLWRD